MWKVENVHGRCRCYWWLIIAGIIGTGYKLIAGIVDAGEQLIVRVNKPAKNTMLRISQRIFINIRYDLNVILRGSVEIDSWKEPEVENLVSDALCNKFDKNFLFYTVT